jgi:hypothetical protein
MAKAPHIMLEPLRIIAKALRITLEPLRIDKMLFDHLRQLWLSIKRKPKMKDDHIACLPYACLLGKNSLPPGSSALW